jgi:hypothetical protein
MPRPWRLLSTWGLRRWSNHTAITRRGQLHLLFVLYDQKWNGFIVLFSNTARAQCSHVLATGPLVIHLTIQRIVKMFSSGLTAPALMIVLVRLSPSRRPENVAVVFKGMFGWLLPWVLRACLVGFSREPSSPTNLFASAESGSRYLSIVCVWLRIYTQTTKHISHTQSLINNNQTSAHYIPRYKHQ